MPAANLGWTRSEMRSPQAWIRNCHVIPMTGHADFATLVFPCLPRPLQPTSAQAFEIFVADDCTADCRHGPLALGRGASD